MRVSGKSVTLMGARRHYTLDVREPRDIHPRFDGREFNASRAA